ncbi:MAG TPA: DUF4915 domain-containing protein [Planktothrix sp.]|jgi:uncharacterized protein (TIGR03032 family)
MERKSHAGKQLTLEGKSRDIPVTGEPADVWWGHHHAQWRQPHQIITQWQPAEDVHPDLLKFRITGEWWRALEKTGMTLVVTREYEHLVMAMCIKNGAPLMTYLSLPHPSGIAFDQRSGKLFIASTRNPNQIYRFGAIDADGYRQDVHVERMDFRALAPLGSSFLPGCLYIHDLAFVDGQLYANAVGENSVVKIDGDNHTRAWWPRCIETKGKPNFGRNLIQLNSIAAGKSIADSYFSASADKISNRFPGQKNFPVKERGVIFQGKTREPIAHGLTRPHSARLREHEGKRSLWVDNSGYGQVGYIENEKLQVVSTLPGWTRGLAFSKDVAFVGTSRVIPKFACYAPGLDTDRTLCGLHAIDTRSGKVLGSISWPTGNQIFSIELIPCQLSQGFPFVAGNRSHDREKLLFYSFAKSSNGRHK